MILEVHNSCIMQISHFQWNFESIFLKIVHQKVLFDSIKEICRTIGVGLRSITERSIDYTVCLVHPNSIHTMYIPSLSLGGIVKRDIFNCISNEQSFM